MNDISIKEYIEVTKYVFLTVFEFLLADWDRQ